MIELIDYGFGHWAYDAGYYAPGVASQHFLVDNGRVAFVDTATQLEFPRALAALDQLGLAREAVDWVILTHIHMDHAGGAGAMMAHFPNARLAVHPRGVQHMADPTRLMAGVVAVYGQEEADRLYGQPIPVDPARIVAASDNMVLQVGERELICFDAPGHARHHLMVYDPAAEVIFTGDAFGVSYRSLDTDGRAFILPSTSPTQFDPDAARTTYDNILRLQPRAVSLAHFGQLANPGVLADDLNRHLDVMTDMARAIGPDADAIAAALTKYFLSRTRAMGVKLTEAALLDVWRLDLTVSAQGLALWRNTLAPSAA